MNSEKRKMHPETETQQRIGMTGKVGAFCDTMGGRCGDRKIGARRRLQ